MHAAAETPTNRRESDTSDEPGVGRQLRPLTVLIDDVGRELSRLRALFENQALNASHFLSIAEAARYLRTEEASVVYLAKRARQLPFHMVGRKMVFSREDLDGFMRRHRRPGVHG